MNRHELNQKHLKDPQPGDYWHEMFCPACLVLEVKNGKVTVCTETESADEGRFWRWKKEIIQEMTLDQFRKFLSYTTIPNKTWASVIPTNKEAQNESTGRL